MSNTQRFISLRQVLWAWIAILTLMARPAALAAQSPVRSQPAEPIGAIVGGMVGASVGITIMMRRPFLEYFGLTVGESLLLAVGVHLGNQSTGDLALDAGVSLNVGVGTMLLFLSTGSGSILTAGALAQLGLTVLAERVVGARAGPAVGIAPRLFANGRSGIGLWVRY